MFWNELPEKNFKFEATTFTLELVWEQLFATDFVVLLPRVAQPII